MKMGDIISIVILVAVGAIVWNLVKSGSSKPVVSSAADAMMTIQDTIADAPEPQNSPDTSIWGYQYTPEPTTNFTAPNRNFD